MYVTVKAALGQREMCGQVFRDLYWEGNLRFQHVFLGLSVYFVLNRFRNTSALSCSEATRFGACAHFLFTSDLITFEAQFSPSYTQAHLKQATTSRLGHCLGEKLV